MTTTGPRKDGREAALRCLLRTETNEAASEDAVAALGLEDVEGPGVVGADAEGEWEYEDASRDQSMSRDMLLGR